MFDIAPSELLLVGFVALVVIGPKDLPKAMRVVGYWVGKARGVARQFRSGFDSMVREAELEEMEKRWASENERIMREHPQTSTSDEHPAADVHPVADVGHVEEDGTAPAVMVDKPVVAPAEPDHAAAPPVPAPVPAAAPVHTPDLFDPAAPGIPDGKPGADDRDVAKS
ncbi:twin-arginine translocase subunit TatB [Sphingomonas ginsenosidivorax]|uniref:Sec-independent protein translocase protein TatB n=1 Tax=Sphingomonas ginsenosidivorax TaxID=862135 RepID=A0A5C6UC74_9SPHN|nr:Sec-independent protein translocase protein TatB [Sphingomonas ginsenosidivorax]TXC70030.1 twin-arginine translocase subunit TatB [Sphingomonas ginsenosidivorax]